MGTNASPDEIRLAITKIIAKTLRIPVDMVQPDSKLVSELGADSMDFVDITFEVERAFGVQFCEEGMINRLEELFGPDILFRDGRLTELGARVIRVRRPEIAPELLQEGTSFVAVNEQMTPESWVRSVIELLAARPMECTDCGSSKLKPSENSRVICESCGAQIGALTQGELLEDWVKEFQTAGDQAP